MKNRLVYSTEQGRICPDCNQPVGDCACDQNNALLGSGDVKIMLETKGRKGKGVTIVKDLAMTADELKVLGKKIKSHCGVGGSVKDGNIEIQGDQRDKVKAFLASLDIKSKLAGGK
ncbi:translation initiation factor [Marinomonas piezotolerans]|uniref:Translation initiation factor n=1 Tax=Marinomonas piezotolerans TaxID=2213058 RepID=A0A370UDS3_9GAMM|nr:translation initiation factor [Marinomonas piezotolerans]RDL45919.1 translation initiation factor [Marinomonas piezotolerans]